MSEALDYALRKLREAPIPADSNFLVARNEAIETIDALLRLEVDAPNAYWALVKKKVGEAVTSLIFHSGPEHDDLIYDIRGGFLDAGVDLAER
ncbi:hypothetical protein ACPWZ6_25800 (plasmid) [Ralstonia pseudosolanacearum]